MYNLPVQPHFGVLNSKVVVYDSYSAELEQLYHETFAKKRSRLLKHKILFPVEVSTVSSVLYKNVTKALSCSL